MDWLDSLLSTKVISLVVLVDRELVFEPKNGLGQEGKARDGVVGLKSEVKAATISASWAAGKRISWGCPPSRGDRFVLLAWGVLLSDLFENGASVPLEISSISQKLNADAAVPITKLFGLVRENPFNFPV
jgi:hypothetical protein